MQIRTVLFDSKYGLKQKSINAIVKDKNGIVWLGTESGLVKFDGLSFCEIIPNIEKYKNSEIARIKIKENTIYLVYRNKGCLTYNINTYKFIEISKVPIFDIAPVTDNIYYTINHNGVLLKHIGSKTIKFKKINSVITRARIEYFANRLFLATDDGLFRINGITNAFEYGSNYDDFKYDLGDNFEFDVSFFDIDLVTRFSMEFLIKSFWMALFRNISSFSCIFSNFENSSLGSDGKMCF